MSDIGGKELSKWIRPRFSDNGAVLIIGSLGAPDMQRSSRDLLSSPSPNEESVTLLSYYSGITHRLLNWMVEEDKYIPPNWNLIWVGGLRRDIVDIEGRRLSYVENPSSFIKTKRELTNHLKTDINSQVLMIDSLTSILQTLDFEVSYIWMENLIRNAKEKNVFTFVRVDKEIHSESKLEIFAELFDGIARLDEESDWRIERN